MLDITANFEQFTKALLAHQKAAAFAEVVALTRTARATAQFEGQEAARVFDRPTPFTLNAFYFRPASADRKVFEIGVKDFAGKGTPASKYLRAQVHGGQRRQKRSEVALATSILTRDRMGNKGYWTPGPGVKLDAYGNVPGSTIRRILSDIQVAGDQSRTAQSRRRNRNYAKERYFVPIAASGLTPGVWVERGGQILPALFFVTETVYEKRFDFLGRGMAFARTRFPIEMDQALREGWHLPRATQRALGLGGRI